MILLTPIALKHNKKDTEYETSALNEIKIN